MPNSTISGVEKVDSRTVALELETPSDFDGVPGQFVLVRGDVNDSETGYYTISSPYMADTFEITVDVAPDGTLGPWLAERSPGESVEVEGPFGDVKYLGESDVVVLASGPGIGPAVGIGEHAVASDQAVTIIYKGLQPPYVDRLEELCSEGAVISLTNDIGAVIETVSLERSAFVFGFEAFIADVRSALKRADLDLQAVAFENFGPE